MAKRTGNSSVNSSIRQQTKSNEEGLTQLLVVQQQSLGHLSTIQSLMEKTANLKEDEQLDLQRESLNIQKKQLVVLEDSETDRKKAQEDIQKLMDGMKTFKSPLERMKEGVKGFAGKFSGENIKKNFLESTNIMGINNKKLEKQKFIKEQKALGSTATAEQLNKNFEGAYAAKKESSKVEQKIQSLRDATGGKYTDEELAKSSKGNADLFGKKAALTQEYSQFDIGAKLKGESKAPMVSPAAVEVGQTPAPIFGSAGEQQEAAAENSKLMNEQTSLLVKIEENTRKGSTGDIGAKTTGAKGGLLDGITGLLGSGLMQSFKTLFSPGNILKALGKVFVIGAIIGSLFEGITDGFNEYMQSGDIGKALIAGLAGIVDFLTFGLFDKEKIKEVIGDFATWTNDHLIQPFVKFIGGIKDSFLSMVQNLGIPKIDISKLTKYIPGAPDSIGPYYPFKSDSSKAPSPSAAPATSGDTVTTASKQNADAAATTGKTTPNTNIVNAPTTNVSKQTQVVALPVRNQDESMSRYMRSRYA